MNMQVRSQHVWEADLSRCSIRFCSRHPVFPPVEGRFGSFRLDVQSEGPFPEGWSIQANIEAASVETGDAQRDQHLRSADFLDVVRYPWITFRSRNARIVSEGSILLRGDLTVRDVTREIALETTYLTPPSGEAAVQRMKFSAATTLLRKDFGVRWNTVLAGSLLLIGDSLTVDVIVELVRRVRPNS